MTSSERHARAKALFFEALAAPAHERDSLIDRASGGDAALAAEVRSLLDHHRPEDEGTLGNNRTPVLRAGDVFAGRYRITALVGSGAMGDVYRARDTTLDVDIAVKVLRERSPERIAQLLDEVRLARRVTHPAICRVYDVAVADGVYFFTMEFVDGENMAELLSRIGRLGSAKVREIGAALCRGLAAAHESGVLHRDIKPTNVMIDAEGEIRITDFGVATVDRARGLDLPAGTPAYMAPEQILDGAPASVATDLYSVGLVLYEALTGTAPAEHADDVARARRTEAFSAPRELVDGLDPDLECVIGDLLRDDPAARPHSAQEVAQRLEAAPSTAVATPTGGPEVGRPYLRPAAWVLTAVAVLLAVLLVRERTETLRHGPMYEVMRPVPEREGIGIAVLPTASSVGSEDLGHLVEAVQDGLIARLSRVAGLRVIAEESTDAFEPTADSRDVGVALGAAYVVRSRIEGAGDQIQFAVELVDARSGESMWSETGSNIDVPEQAFAAERELCQHIVETVLADPPMAPLATEPITRHREAYARYLRGREHVPPFTKVEFESSVSFLKEAVEIDPEMASGYAALGTAYTIASIVGWVRPAEGYGAARRYTARALALDDSLDEAHVAMGAIVAEYDWNWRGAEAEFRRALELNPSSDWAWRTYARFLSILARFDEALDATRRSIELNPTSAIVMQGGAQRMYEARNYDRAAAMGRIAIRLDPLYPVSYATLGFTLIEQGRYTEAIAQMTKSMQLIGRDAGSLGRLAYAHARAGDRERATEILSEARSLHEPGGVESTLLALAAGDHDGAMAALADAVAHHAPPSIWLTASPVVDPLRGRSDYLELVRRVGLPEAM